MQFFTKVSILTNSNAISYHSKIVSVGSCFAENIGQKFDFFKFQNTTNPFGIIFNAISIEKIIRRAIHKDYFSEDEIFFHNEGWHSFHVHSQLSHPDKDFFLKQLNDKLDFFYADILSATHFTITLGTSWVYKIVTTEEIVANCHKLPQKQFSKKLLSSAEIEVSLNKIVSLVKEINSNCHFIFTISPVRHLKDGFVENQMSKANLISAVYNLVQKQQKNSNLDYFPSYEIMMDELRDYRFYSQDLLHPNATAIDYIWSRFVDTYIGELTISTMIEVESIQKGLNHSPFNNESLSHAKFLKDLRRKIDRVQNMHSFITF